MISQLAKGRGWTLRRAEHFSTDAEQGEQCGCLLRGRRGCCAEGIQMGWKDALGASWLPSLLAHGTACGCFWFAPADTGWHNFTNTYGATPGEQGQVTARLVKVLHRHINMNKYIRQCFALQAGVLWLRSVQDRAAWRGGTASARAGVKAEEQLQRGAGLGGHLLPQQTANSREWERRARQSAVPKAKHLAQPEGQHQL